MTTNSWTAGAGTFNFGTKGDADSDWSSGFTPDSTEDAVINTGSGTATITANSLEQVGSIALGTHDTLIIDNDTVFAAFNGTGTNADNGIIDVSNAAFIIGSGGAATFDDGGFDALQLNGITPPDPTPSGGPASLIINGSVDLTGSGGVSLEIADGNVLDSNDFIEGDFLAATTPTLTNVSETISGAGTIGGNLNFINESTVGTGVAFTDGGQGGLTIEGSAAGGGFTNETGGQVIVGDGGSITLGVDGETSSIINAGGVITLQFVHIGTKLEIAGNVTIGSTGTAGSIDLAASGGANSGANRIISDGKSATLTLVNQDLQGVGEVSDANLTLDNQSVIDANSIPFMGGPGLVLNTGSNTITNGAGALLEADGAELEIESPVDNAGEVEAVGDGEVLIDATNGGFTNTGNLVADFGSDFVIAGQLNNSGTVTDDGDMVFEQPVSSSGTIDIGPGAILTADSTISGNVTFAGSSATLELQNPFALGANDIIGAANDKIIFTGLTFSPSIQLVWQQTSSSGGTLSLVNDGAPIASVNLAGEYTSAAFGLVAIGSSPTVLIPNPNPPSGTTADMIMSDGSGDYETFNLGNNGIVAAYGLGQVSTAWQVAGVGGFDGTDTSDMMLRNSSSGAFEVYDIGNNNNTNIVSMGQVGLAWGVSGFADFSGNPGETDMLLQNSGTGAFEVYDISNNQISFATSMGQVGAPWAVAGFGDFSGNAGETGDMLMRNGQTGAFEVYDISNNTITFATSMGQVGLAWSVVGFGDFSGNGNETDMLMRDSQNGAFEIYDISNNAIYNDGSMGQVGLEWQVAGFGPIDGAGMSDMLMRNINTGAFEIYDIAGNQLVNAASMGQVGTEWSVAGIAADPPGSSPANTQLAQAMASFSSAGSSFDAGSPLGQPVASPPAASPLAAASDQPHPA